MYSSVAILFALFFLAFSLPYENSSEENLDHSTETDCVYDLESNKCYPNGSQGPCSKYEVWSRDAPLSAFGRCGCITQANHCEGKFNRPIARSKADGKCYPLYHKENCKEDEWFFVDKNWDGICADNPCEGLTGSEVSPEKLSDVREALGQNFDDLPKDRLDVALNSAPKGVHPWEINKPSWYLHKGRCYKTFTQGHCDHTNQTALFDGTGVTPACVQISYMENGSVYPWGCAVTVVHLLNSDVPPCPPGYVREGADCKPASGISPLIEEE